MPTGYGTEDGGSGTDLRTFPNVTAAHTWTAFGEIAIAPFESDALVLELYNNPPSLINSAVFQVAVGALGFERVVLTCSFSKGTNGPQARERWLWFPYRVRAGERISVRQRNGSGTNGGDYTGSAGVVFVPRSGAWPAGCQMAEVLGLTADSSTSWGVLLTDVGNSAFGAWHEIGTTTFPWRYVIASTHKDGIAGGFVRVTAQFGIGPTGDVRVIGQRNLHLGGGQDIPPIAGPFPVAGRAGEKMWVRAKQNGAGAGRFFGCFFSGIG